MAPEPARLIDTGAHDQPVEPGVEAVRVPQRGQITPGSDERVLDGVLGLFGIPEDQPGGRVQAGDRGACQLGEGVMIASLARSTRSRCIPPLGRGATDRPRSSSMARHPTPNCSRPLTVGRSAARLDSADAHRDHAPTVGRRHARRSRADVRRDAVVRAPGGRGRTRRHMGVRPLAVPLPGSAGWWRSGGVDDARRTRGGRAARRAWRARHVRIVPEPGPHGQDGRHARRPGRRSRHPRPRVRLARPGIRRVRLSDRPPRRPVRRGPRDQRPAPPGASVSRSRDAGARSTMPSSSPRRPGGCRSWSPLGKTGCSA